MQSSVYVYFELKYQTVVSVRVYFTDKIFINTRVKQLQYFAVKQFVVELVV